MLTLLAIAALADTVATELPSRPPDERWVATVAVLGERKIPILGTVRFRTDTNALADVWRTEQGWLISQQTCGVRFAKTAGAVLTLAEHAPSAMPPAVMTFVQQDEVWSAGPWPSGWSESDHDGDGKPGITVNVKAPICGQGELHVESEATSVARGAPGDGTTLEGDILVRVIQTNHSAKGLCLKLLPTRTDETMLGRFAYQQVPVDTTCSTVTAFPDPQPEKAQPLDASLLQD